MLTSSLQEKSKPKRASTSRQDFSLQCDEDPRGLISDPRGLLSDVAGRSIEIEIKVLSFLDALRRGWF